jgi:DNA-binding winged helix-turn-helix (wHTH) protein
LEDVIVQKAPAAPVYCVHSFVILTKPRRPNDSVALATPTDSSAMATGGTRTNINTRLAFIGASLTGSRHIPETRFSSRLRGKLPGATIRCPEKTHRKRQENAKKAAGMRRFRSFVVDEGRRQLLRDGRELHLTPKAFDTLLLLLDAAPRVVRKSELHDRLWPNGIVSDASLVGLVGEIRRALGDQDPDARIIRAVPRVGYAFDAPITVEATTPVEREQRTSIKHWLVWRARRVNLTNGTNLIGRDPDSRLWLDYSTVSRRHAQIVVGDAGALLEDLGSKNGTRLRDTPVTRPTLLHDGDRIVFGRMIVTYRESAAGLSTVTELSRVENFWSR